MIVPFCDMIRWLKLCQVFPLLELLPLFYHHCVYGSVQRMAMDTLLIFPLTIWQKRTTPAATCTFLCRCIWLRHSSGCCSIYWNFFWKFHNGILVILKLFSDEDDLFGWSFPFWQRRLLPLPLAGELEGTAGCFVKAWCLNENRGEVIRLA